MLPEQTLNNMSFKELLSYSETFSDIPARVTRVISEKLEEAFSELEEAHQTNNAMEIEIADLEHENDDLRAALNEAEDVICQVIDYLDQYVDADCDQDGYIPNEEMNLTTKLEETLKLIQQRI